VNVLVKRMPRDKVLKLIIARGQKRLYSLEKVQNMIKEHAGRDS